MDGGGHGADGDSFAKLPTDCLVQLLSFTTPRDLCRSAAVSKSFLSATESDAVWECFLPPDCTDILSQAVPPVEFSSNKELYMRLCQPIFLQDGKMSFQLERTTGKKTYMISAEKMSIAWGNDPRYWRWISLPQSRFGKVAELIWVCWLSISGSISSRLLSQRTVYEVYMVFKLAAGAYGLHAATQLGSINLGAYASEKRIDLLNLGPYASENDDDDDEADNDVDDEAENDDDDDEAENGDDDGDSDDRTVEEAEKDVGRLSEDGWLEISLGEFYNDEGDEGDVAMSLREVTDLGSKRGLILLGFELRPKAMT